MRALHTTRPQRKHRLGRCLLHALLGALALVFALPLLLIGSASISDERAVLLHGYRFWPVGLSLEAYRYIARDPTQLLTGYRLSLLTTALGTILGLLLCSSLAYALSRRQFRLRNVLAFLVYFPILFQGGLVPFYILVTKYLGLKDTLLALILPSAVVPWYVLILRTYMRGLPEELLDAARVDGAGEVRIYFQIALPLCLPALTTVGLFYVLLYWNDWFTPLLFITRPSLTPLQYLLYRTMADLQFLTDNMSRMSSGQTPPPLPLATIRMALAVLGAAPVVVIFLFLQRYFISGLTLGAFKGES
jgi:putative aldouronate transport system permease protein